MTLLIRILHIVSEFTVLFLAVSLRSCLAQDTYYRSGDLTYIKPSDSGNYRNWTSAQQYCSSIQATLPVLDNDIRRSTFLEALYYFRLNSISQYIWIAAKATYEDPKYWKWTDGTTYTGPAVPGLPDFLFSYALISNSGASVTINASISAFLYPYICQYSTSGNACDFSSRNFISGGSCYTKYENRLPWFEARNNCLSNGGDIAVFHDLSVVSQYLSSTQYWIGLLSSWWNWENAVTNQLTDITITQWSPSQPNDPSPECGSVNSSDIPNWLDVECSYASYFICQRDNSWTTPAPISSTYKTPTQRGLDSLPIVSIPVASITATTTSMTISTTATLSITSNNTKELKSNRTLSEVTESSLKPTPNLPLILGVAFGVPVILLIVIIIIVLSCKKRNSASKMPKDEGQQPPATEYANALQPPIDGLYALPSMSQDHEIPEHPYAELRRPSFI